MAFHVDGGSARHRAQRRLGGLRHHDLLDPREPAPDDAAHREVCDLFFADGKTGKPAPVAGGDFGRHHDIARFEGGIEASGDAEGNDPTDGRGIEDGEQRTQLLRIAGTTDDGFSRAGRDSGLLDQPCHNEYRPRVHQTRGRFAPLRIHIPTPTTLLLVTFKFLYRASAHNGKNFG